MVAAFWLGAVPLATRGFNPCKGFGVVAAAGAWALHLPRLRSRFNPCKGFGVVAAVAICRCVEPVINGVSIPVRVLGWLQQVPSPVRGV